MMNKQALHKRTVIRFRYWSRKEYAVFASLGKNVTIGSLRKNVVEQSLTKQIVPGESCVGTSIVTICELQESDVILSLVEERPEQQWPMIWVKATAEAAPAYIIVSVIPIYNVEVISHSGMLPLFSLPIRV